MRGREGTWDVVKAEEQRGEQRSRGVGMRKVRYSEQIACSDFVRTHTQCLPAPACLTPYHHASRPRFPPTQPTPPPSTCWCATIPVAARGVFLHRKHLIREPALKNDMRSSRACYASAHRPVSECLAERRRMRGLNRLR